MVCDDLFRLSLVTSTSRLFPSVPLRVRDGVERDDLFQLSLVTSGRLTIVSFSVLLRGREGVKFEGLVQSSPASVWLELKVAVAFGHLYHLALISDPTPCLCVCHGEEEMEE